MPSFTLGQAARATGRSKSALSRDVRAGRISATRNPDGTLGIDAAELARVFPAMSHGNGSDNVPRDDQQPPGGTAGTGFERRENALLRQMLADKDEVIRDLQARLDAADARLDRLLLTDRRGDDTTDLPSLSRWQRWVRWRSGKS